MKPMIFLSILLLISAVLLLKRKIHSRLLSILIATTTFILFFTSIFYYVSDHLTGNGIDESVFYHLSMSMSGTGLSEFYYLILFSCLSLALAISVTVFTYKLIYSLQVVGKHSISYAISVLLIFSAFYVNPGVSDLLDAYSVMNHNLPNTTPDGYISFNKKTLTTNNKNIVYVYLESFERTYLDESLFPNLTPNLKQLEQESLNFTDIHQVYGSGWTIAGMVNSQCGIPLVTPSGGNSMSGTDKFLPDALCLGDILQAQGYDLNYLGGASLEFAGKGKFYNSHGFKEVVGLDEIVSNPNFSDDLNAWGLYDDSLFKLAKTKFDQLAHTKTPFGLFTLTLDTHHPRGHKSPSCSNMEYGDGTNEILNAIHCSDKLIYDFVQHIKSSDAYKDTLIVISSDHLAMPNTAYEKLKAGDRKNLLLIMGSELKPQTISKSGALIDVAPTILSTLGVDKDGLGFGRNLLSDTPTFTDLADNINSLLSSHRSFFSSLWSFPQINDGLVFNNDAKELHLGARHIKYPALLILNDKLNVDQIKFQFSSPKKLYEEVIDLKVDQKFIWIDLCNKTLVFNDSSNPVKDGYCIAYGSLDSKKIEHSALVPNHEFGFITLKSFFNNNTKSTHDANIRISKIQLLKKYGTFDLYTFTPSENLLGDFLITSAGGFKSGATVIKNISTGKLAHATRGTTLFGVNNKDAPVKIKHIDTCASKDPNLLDDTYTFQNDIDKTSELFGAFVIVAHDSAVCNNNQLENLLTDTGLKEFKKIGFRTPYIGVITGNGSVKEFHGEKETKITVAAKSFIRPL